VLASTAIVCTGLFAGAALYISVVEQPATRELGDALSGRFFPAMYRRAAPVQGGLAVVGSLCSASMWLLGAGALWLLGSLLLGLVVPFTLLVIKPVNDRLLAGDLDPAAPESAVLLSRWATLHAVRTISSLLAFLVCLAARASV
jgi:hypothetical protein